MLSAVKNKWRWAWLDEKVDGKAIQVLVSNDERTRSLFLLRVQQKSVIWQHGSNDKNTLFKRGVENISVSGFFFALSPG